MNAKNLYEYLCQIFQEKCFSTKLINQLESENITEFKTTIKLYILKFLLNQDDVNHFIQSSNDIWFIKDKASNIDLIIKYIELMINLIKTDDFSKINIYKEIEIFINTEIGNKLIYIISIINKLYLPEQINLLFIGFLLGEKKEFIKTNYLKNFQNLLSLAGSDIVINSQMKIFSLSEEILEVVNLFVFFLINIEEDKNSINSLKKFLISPLESDEININVYYKKLENYGMIEKLFCDDYNDIRSNIYKQNVSNLLDIIKIKIEDIHINNKDSNIIEESKEKIDNKKILFPNIFSDEITDMNTFSPSHINKSIINLDLSLNKKNESEKIQTNNHFCSRLEISLHNSEISIVGETNKNKKNNKQLNIKEAINSITPSYHQKSKGENNILDYINQFIEYPKLSDLKIDSIEESPNKDFYFNANSVFLLFQCNYKVALL